MALTKPKLSQNIDTDISVFSDPILVLHQGSILADVDVGFLMNRSNGLTANAAVIWQESSKSFVHILTNSSGVANANLVVQSYANVSVGNVLLINNAGIYVDGSLGTAGQVLTSDGSKVYWATGGGGGGGGGNTYTANTAPPTSGNVAGDMWYDTNADILYEYLDDGSTKYWVDVQSLGQTGNIVSMVDTTLSGNIVVGLSNVYSIGTSTGYVRNIFANAITSNLITVNGNITATGNVVTTQSVIATGNITANYFVGDGSKLTNTVTTGKAIAMSIVFGG
jgi:hypothetical protein